MLLLLLVTAALVPKVAAFGNVVTVPCNQTAPLAVVNDTLYNVRDCGCGVAIQMTLPPGLSLENVAIRAVNSFVTFGSKGSGAIRNFEYRWANYSDRPCRLATTGAMVSDFYAAGAVTLRSGVLGVFSGVTLEMSNCDIDMRPVALTPASLFSISGGTVDRVENLTASMTNVTLTVRSAFQDGYLSGWLLLLDSDVVRTISNLSVTLSGLSADVASLLWQRLVTFGSLEVSSDVSLVIRNSSIVSRSEAVYFVFLLGPSLVRFSFVCTDVSLSCSMSYGFAALLYSEDVTVCSNVVVTVARVTAQFSLSADNSSTVPFASLVSLGLVVDAIIRCDEILVYVVIAQSSSPAAPVTAIQHFGSTIFTGMNPVASNVLITNSHIRCSLGAMEGGGQILVALPEFHLVSAVISLDRTKLQNSNATNVSVSCLNVSSTTSAVNLTVSSKPSAFASVGVYCGIVSFSIPRTIGISIELVNAVADFYVDLTTIQTLGLQQEFPLQSSRSIRWNITMGSALLSLAYPIREVDVLGSVSQSIKDVLTAAFAATVGAYFASDANITVVNSTSRTLRLHSRSTLSLPASAPSSVIIRSSLIVVANLHGSIISIANSSSEHIVFGTNPSAMRNSTMNLLGLHGIKDVLANIPVFENIRVVSSNCQFSIKDQYTGLTSSFAVVDPVPAFSSPNGTAISNLSLSMANCTAEGYDALFPCSVTPGCRVDAASRVSLWCVAMRYASSDPWSLVAAGDAVRVGGSFSTVDDAAIGRNGACWLEHTTKANRVLQATGPLISAVALTSAVGGGQLGFAAAALQRSLLAASLALKCGADAGSDEEVPPLSFSDSPTRLEAAGISFGGATDAAVLQSAGATLGNVLLLCGCGCALVALGAWRCWRAMPVGGTIQAADVAVAARLPSSLLWLLALLLQPSVQHGLASMSAAAGNAATVVVGAVGVACFVCPVVIVFAAVFWHRHEVVAIRRPIDRSLVSGSSCVVQWRARLYWRGWDWRLMRGAAAVSSVRLRSGAVMLATCGAYFRECRSGAMHYFMVDAVCGALCATAAGISVPAEACMVPAYVVLGVSAVSLALLLVVRPYATLAGNMFTALNNALTVLCAALALVPSAQGTVSGIALFQTVLALALALSSLWVRWTIDGLDPCCLTESIRGVRSAYRNSVGHRFNACHRNLLPAFAFPLDRLKSTPGSGEDNLSVLVMAICDSRPPKDKMRTR